MNDLLRYFRAAAREVLPLARVKVGREGDGPSSDRDTWWCVVTAYFPDLGADLPVMPSRGWARQEDAIRECARTFVDAHHDKHALHIEALRGALDAIGGAT
jgi:hypothetical protein